MKLKQLFALMLSLVLMLTSACPAAVAEEPAAASVALSDLAEGLLQAFLPAAAPATEPTAAPDIELTPEASSEPSIGPSAEPTADPSTAPTAVSSIEPTAEPSVAPSIEPSITPSIEPSAVPSAEPTAEATPAPMAEPSVEPSADPSIEPAATSSPEVAVEILPQPAALTLGKGETVALPAFSLLPESALDTVSYESGTSGLRIDLNKRTLTAAETGSHFLTLRASGGASVQVPVAVLPAPKKVSLSADRTAVCAGETITCTALLPEGSAGSFSYSISNPSLLRDNGDGSFTALAKGNVRIRVKTYNGKTDDIYIKINAAPASISLSEHNLLLAQGESHTLTAQLNKGSVCSARFASSDESILTVDASGRLFALSTGEATITASTCNGLSDSCTVQVCPAPASLSLAADKTILGVQESARLLVAFQPEGSGGRLTFASSNPKIARVSADGIITAVRTGSAVVTASTATGAAASVEITVLRAPNKISISSGRTRIGLGETITCSAVLPQNCAGAVSFSCADSGVLESLGNGSFAATGTGQTTVTATAYNGKTAAITVEVCAAPQSLALNRSEITLGAADSFALAPILPENSAGAVSYTSSNPAIAAVSADGLISAITPGQAAITASTYNGHTAKCLVSVCPAPEQILVSMPATLLGVKEQMPITVTLLPEGSAASLRFSSSRAGTIDVTDTGVVSGRRESTAVITVETHNGLKETIAVEVDKAPTSATLSVSNVSPAIGETITAQTSISKYSAGTVTLSTDRPDILEIRPDGSIRAVGPGIAVLTATTFNGKTDSETIIVLSMPEEIFLPARMQMAVGSSASIQATLPKDTASAIVYESLNPGCVQADTNGNLRALSLGEAVIRATAVNSGASAECIVQVLSLPEQMLLSETQITMMLGQRLSISCSFLPENSYSPLTYEPANRRIVDVDASGALVALKTGATTVTIRTLNGLTGSITVNVPPAPEEINLSDRCIYLQSGETHALSYKLDFGAQTIVSYSSSDPEIASVDSATGLIQAHATGTACITARTLNGMHASCVVNVNMDAEIDVETTGDFQIIFMDIGRNDGIIIACNGEYAFFDSGYYRYGQQAVDYMHSLGITKLKYYVGTHAHKDHVGGAGVIIEAMDVDMVVAPHSYVFDCIRRFCMTSAERAAVDETPTYIMKPEDQIYLGGAKITCLGPITCQPHNYKNTAENNNSLVTRVVYGENSFLLTGDATNKELTEIENTYPGSTKADVLKNPHHNGYQPMEVIEKVMPKIVVFSTSNGARPKTKYKEMFKSLGSEIYITAPAEHSHVSITSDGRNIIVETASKPKED